MKHFKLAIKPSPPVARLLKFLCLFCIPPWFSSQFSQSVLTTLKTDPLYSVIAPQKDWLSESALTFPVYAPVFPVQADAAGHVILVHAPQNMS